MFLTHIRARLFTVLFFRKIIEIERFVLRAAILHECLNYLGDGGALQGSEKNRGTVRNNVTAARVQE